MKYASGNKTLLIIVFFMLPFTACVKEEFTLSKLDTSVDLKPALATPIGFFDFRLDENLQTTENAIITTNPNRIVSLNYYGDISSEPAGALFQFDNILEEFLLPNPTGGIIDLSDTPYNIKSSARVPLFLTNTGGIAEIDSIQLSNGLITVSDILFPNVEAEALIRIPGLKRNGKSFEMILTPGESRFFSNINGYSLELVHEENRKNLIEVEISLNFPQQNNILFATLPLINFSFEIELEEWKKIFGYLGSENIDFGRINFSTDIQDNFPGGEFYSVEPVLNFKTSNSFSIPMALGISEIIAQTTDAGAISVTGPGVPTPPDYFYPAYPSPENMPGEARDSMTIDSDNSNLEDVTTSSPESMSYHVEFLTNPDGISYENVIHNESKFSTRVELQLPFHGRAKSLTVMDTMAIDFSNLNIPVDNAIKQVIFKLYYENSFPAEIDLQLYLADENLLITDTVFNSAAKVRAAEPSDVFIEDPEFVSGELEASMPGEKLPDVRAARYIIGEALLSTNEDYEKVKIFDNQNLFLNLGIVFDISTNIEDF